MQKKCSSRLNFFSQRKKRGIIILGGGVMQMPAIEAAAELGLKSICFDGSSSCPGAEAADVFYNIDLKDFKAVAVKSVELKDAGVAHGIVTAGTDFSFTAAYAAEAAGWVGNSIDVARATTDKGIMRKVLADSGVNVPGFATLSSDCSNQTELLEQIVDKYGFPLVVKPADSMGGRGTVRTENMLQLGEAVEEAMPYSRSGQVIIEEFLDGPEFSIDALVLDGEIYLCGVADRHVFYPPRFIEMGHTMPSNMSAEIIKEVTEEFIKGVKALGITFGAAKGDIKYCRGKGAFIGEIASRLSGGYMSGWTYPYSHLYNPVKSAILIALGDSFPAPPISNIYVSAERAFVSIPGGALEIEGSEKAAEVEGVRDMFFRTGAGDRVDFPDNNIEKCGNVITSAASRHDAVSAAQEAVSNIFIRLKPDEQSTFDYLIRNIRKIQMPDAYFYSRDKFNKLLEQAEVVFCREKKSFFLENMELPEGKCWNGLSSAQAYDILNKKEIISFGSERSLQTIAFPVSLFLTVFCRGGVQGVAWLRDSLLESDQIQEKVFKWEKDFIPLF